MQEFHKMTPEQLIDYASGRGIGFATTGPGHALKLALDLQILRQSTLNAKSVADALTAFEASTKASSKLMCRQTWWIIIATAVYAATAVGPVVGSVAISIYGWVVSR